MSYFIRFRILPALLGSSLAIGMGLTVATVSYAAPPAQTAPDVSVANSLLSLILALVAGGALAYLLDDIPAWRDWAPTVKWAKPLLVILLTALIGGGIAALQTELPNVFSHIPAAIQAALTWAAAYLASQFIHERDVMFQYRQRAERQIAEGTRFNAR